MNRRFCKSLSLWILPLLLLRALIPTGFMLAPDAGGLSLVFCSAATPQSALANAAVQGEGHAGHHVGHDNDPRPGDHASASQHNAPCPFSLAAIAAAGDVPYFVSIAAIPVDEPFEFFSAPTSSAGPLRADPIRGPPSLA
jgi:hypothetical protein